MTTITVTSLVVPPLTDNTVAFANVDAWNSYWAGANFQATVPVADTTTYGVMMAATTVAFVAPVLPNTNYITMQIDLGNGAGLQPYKMVLSSSFDALVAAFNQLLADYTTTKVALKASGQISNA